MRDFVDTEINPNAADWEEAGEVPKYVSESSGDHNQVLTSWLSKLFERFVAAGFVGPSVPRKYRGGARMPADVEGKQVDLAASRDRSIHDPNHDASLGRIPRDDSRCNRQTDIGGKLNES